MTDAKTSPGAVRTLLSLVFFLSGASALVFETLWFRLTGLTFGNGVWASALVLSSFMAGLALGNGLAARLGRDVQRPVRLYALVELAICVTGVGLVLLLSTASGLLARLLGPLLGAPALLNLTRFTLAFLLLIVPATAMGTTLPLLVKALAKSAGDFGRALGRLYGWNTLGAVAGALSGELFLIEALGVRGAGIFAGGLNLLAAVIALGLARTLEPAPSRVEVHLKERPRLGNRGQCLLAASFLSGLLLLAFEVLWFRFLLLFTQGTTLTFSVMLAVVLAGIGLGGLGAALWFRFDERAERRASALAFALGALALGLYASFGAFLGERTEIEVRGFGLDVLPAAIALMFPVSLLSGALFSLLGSALFAVLGDETRATGLTTLANTLGATVGPVLAGFFVIPAIGMEHTFLLLGLAYGVVGLAALVPGAPRRLEIGAGVLLLVAAALFPHGRMRDWFDLASASYRTDGSVVFAVHEGRTETLQYMRRDYLGEPEYYRLVTNSFSMSGTHAGARRYMKAYVYWPIAMLPDLDSALLISFGTGSTAKALTDTRELSEIVIVDTSREILDLSDLVFPEEGTNPLDDPRVETYVEDGRFYLAATDRMFDLITSEPPPPKVAGVVSLYTKEYFELIRSRLLPGGACTYWLPVVQLEPDETRAIVRAFVDVFGDHASLWSGCGFDWMLIGTNGPSPRVQDARLRAQWEKPELAGELLALGFELPEQIATSFLMGADDLRRLTAEVEPLTDDRPKRLSAWMQTTPEAIEWHKSVMDVERSRTLFDDYGQKHWPGKLSLEKAWIGEAALREITRPDRGASIDFGLLHRVLTRTELRIPVLWSFGATQRVIDLTLAADAAGAERGWREAYYLAVDALARRAYREADALFAESNALRENLSLLPLRVLALELGGRGDEADRLFEQRREFFEGRPLGKGFRAWFGETFGR